MSHFAQILQELFFRTRLFLFGIRFYETVTAPEGELVFSHTCELGEEVSVRFNFHRVICSDFFLKRMKLTKQSYASYTITPVFITDYPPELEAINRRTFFFNSIVNGFGIDESRTLQLIADVYLDFMQGSLPHLKT